MLEIFRNTVGILPQERGGSKTHLSDNYGETDWAVCMGICFSSFCYCWDGEIKCWANNLRLDSKPVRIFFLESLGSDGINTYLIGGESWLKITNRGIDVVRLMSTTLTVQGLRAAQTFLVCHLPLTSITLGPKPSCNPRGHNWPLLHQDFQLRAAACKRTQPFSYARVWFGAA